MSRTARQQAAVWSAIGPLGQDMLRLLAQGPRDRHGLFVGLHCRDIAPVLLSAFRRRLVRTEIVASEVAGRVNTISFANRIAITERGRALLALNPL